jgi:hypothetical protein
MQSKKPMAVVAALAVAGGAAAFALPSGAQVTTEVSEVSGGAFGAVAEIRSDLVVLPAPSTIEALVQAAYDEDAAAATTALAETDLQEAPGEGGTVVISAGPAPEVELPAEGGGPFTDSLATFEVDGGQIAGLAEVSTEGELGTSGFAASSATLAELDVLGILGAELVSTECSADLDETVGSTSLLNAGGIISGAFPDDPAPNTPSPFNTNTTIPVGIDGTTITVEYQTTLNEQVSDGTELIVNGLHVFLSIRVDPEGAGVGDPELVLLEVEGIASQSRCGVVEADIPPDPGPVDPTPSGPVPGSPSFAG